MKAPLLSNFEFDKNHNGTLFYNDLFRINVKELNNEIYLIEKITIITDYLQDNEESSKETINIEDLPFKVNDRVQFKQKLTKLIL